MLQETINDWKVYHSSYELLEKWLNEGEHALRRSAEEKLVSTNSSHNQEARSLS